MYKFHPRTNLKLLSVCVELSNATNREEVEEEEEETFFVPTRWRPNRSNLTAISTG
jgi:hypothetical protein